MNHLSLTQRKANRPAVVPSKEFHGIAHHEDYAISKKLGEGTFGIVYKAVSKKHNKLVALKRILQRDVEDPFPVTAFREMTVLRVLRDDNIVELLEVIADKPAAHEEKQEMTSKAAKSFYFVFPYMSYDLTGILQNPDIQLTESDNKSIMMQMFRGLEFIHQQGYLHRDIKASNILINVRGLLKIGDFGLARLYKGAKPTRDAPGGGLSPMTEVVMTRWYRAPEVLMGNRNYTTAVDLWACGCILGELYEKKPILPGKSDLDQAYDIFRLIGEPNERTMPDFNSLKMAEKLRVTPSPNTIRQRFGDRMSDEAMDLMGELLVLDHYQRFTASRSMEHEWFKQEPLPTELVKTNFPECHEADVIKKKQLDKSQTQKSFPHPQQQQQQQQQHHHHHSVPPQATQAQAQSYGSNNNHPQHKFSAAPAQALVQPPSLPQDVFGMPVPLPTRPSHAYNDMSDYTPNPNSNPYTPQSHQQHYHRQHNNHHHHHHQPPYQHSDAPPPTHTPTSTNGTNSAFRPTAPQPPPPSSQQRRDYPSYPNSGWGRQSNEPPRRFVDRSRPPPHGPSANGNGNYRQQERYPTGPKRGWTGDTFRPQGPSSGSGGAPGAYFPDGTHKRQRAESFGSGKRGTYRQGNGGNGVNDDFYS